MKKKFVIDSIFVVLLMLVSTQTVLMNIVKSWPSEHEGDADVGDMWISELNTSSVLTNVKNVSIGHANATHDWVKWLGGMGTVKANWSVDIENHHPEYWVSFTLLVYNVDDNCSEIGNASFMKTYNANTSYDESGTLQVSVAFDPDFLRENTNATLLCYLDTWVVLNNTAEAVNFTSWAVDRCVVGVSLDTDEAFEPFTRFTDEANEKWPHMWSWLGGWNLSSRFDDEEDMLNNQTCFITGENEPQDSSGDWDLGSFQVVLNEKMILIFTDGQLDFYAGQQTSTFYISCHVDVTITKGTSKNKNAYVRYQLWKENKYPAWNPINLPGGYNIGGPYSYPHTIRAHPNDDLGDEQGIQMAGLIWAMSKGLFRHPLRIPQDWNEDYVIKFTGPLHQGTSSDEGSHYWETSCVYQNHSFDVSASSSTANGITTVQADITEVLQSQSTNETVYSFSGERGDTRVEFTT